MPILDAPAVLSTAPPLRGRMVVRSLLAGGGALFLLLLVYVAWANWLPSAGYAPPPPPSPNGFDAILAAAYKLPPGSRWSDSPRKATLAQLKASIEPSEPALDELRRALRLECRVTESLDPNAAFPSARLREAMRRLGGSSHLALREGDADLACDRAFDLLRLGERLEHGSGFASYFVALAALRTGAGYAEDAVAGLSTSAARARGAELDCLMAALPSYQQALRERRGWSIAGFGQGLRRPDAVLQAYDVDLDNHPAWARSTERSLASLLYPKPPALHAYTVYYDELIRNCAAPFPQRVFRPAADPLVRKDWEILEQSYGVMGAEHAGVEAGLRLLRLELALREHQARTGAFPTTLEQLRPAILKALPIDPFSGRPFIYRRSGASYLLYSVGPDGRDDGGTPLKRLSPLHAGRLNGDVGDLVAGQFHK